MVKVSELHSIYAGKKVFVTGHTGFKGSWFLALLGTLGAIVKGYALDPEDPCSLYQKLVTRGMGESIIADIRDKERLIKEIQAFKPDFIFHLAAQSLVRRSYEIPAETFDINVIGTANLLEGVSRLTGKCTVIVITTDKVYENREQNILYNEKDMLGGHDPYSASKACVELVVNAFRTSFFNLSDFSPCSKVIASARAGNVIGGGDWSKDRIIPDIVRSINNGVPAVVRNPFSIRPWQHVLEPLVGYLQLGACLNESPVEFSGAYNFGPLPEDHLTVEELVTLAIRIWGKGEWVFKEDKNQPHEAGYLKLDIRKSVSTLGWKPALKAADAVRWTMEWYRTDSEKQVEFTFQQINSYLTL